LVAELGAIYEVVAAQRGRKLSVQVPDLPLPAFADRAYLERAFINLIENALKYTPPGSHVRVIATYHNAGTLVEVADDGPGIPESDLAHIFERHYRAAPHRKADSGTTGTGLGLTIVKRVIDAHHGRVSVMNLAGGGACFRVWLPATPRLTEAAPMLRATPASP
jgi:two-component system, OmpR family, sensor histidine kinase KdpD